MKIAFISMCGPQWGGSEELWSSTAQYALSEGHQVLVSVSRWPSLHPRIQALEKSGASLVQRRRYYPAFPTRIRKKVANLFLPQGRKITYHDYILQYGPDHILFSLAGGTEIAEDAGDMMVFVRQTKIPFSVMYHSLSPGYTYPDELAENMRTIFSKAANNLFASHFQADLYRSQFGHPIANATLFAHTVRAIRAFPMPGLTGPVRMCLIGSLVKRWKGQDIAIEVLSSPVWASRNWQLDIYGIGEDRDELMDRVASGGLSERVRFHGFIEDIENVLASHHLVLIPSRQDGAPIVFFEAMLAGRPVVGTQMGSMPEWIQDGVTGFMSSSIDSEGFGDALERAWALRDHWADIGIKAHEQLRRLQDPNPQKSLLKLISE